MAEQKEKELKDKEPKTGATDAVNSNESIRDYSASTTAIALMPLKQKMMCAQEESTDYVLKSSGNNTMGSGYAYPKEGDILAVLKPLFDKHRFGVHIELDGTPKITNNGKMVDFECPALMIYEDFDSDEKEIDHIFLAATGNDRAKAMGSALTYANKFWLKKRFLMPDDLGDDPDTVANSKAIKQNEEHVAKELDRIIKYIQSGKTEKTKDDHRAAVRQAMGLQPGDPILPEAVSSAVRENPDVFKTIK